MKTKTIIDLLTVTVNGHNDALTVGQTVIDTLRELPRKDVERAIWGESEQDIVVVCRVGEQVKTPVLSAWNKIKAELDSGAAPELPPPPEPPPGRVIREGTEPPLPPADVMRKELSLALYNLTRTLEAPEHSQIMDDKDRKRLEQAKQALKKYQNIKDCLR